MKKMIIIFWSGLFPVSAIAEGSVQNIHEGGLVCRRDDLYFSRPYYLVLHEQTVLGPWVTIDTPERLRSLQRVKYHTFSSNISWGAYTLILDTLRLEFRTSSVNRQVWQCEVMDAKHLELAVLGRYRKLSK